MKSFRITAGVLALALLASGTAAADNKFGIGAKAGTLGIGLEATWRPLPYLDVRLGANQFDYDTDASQSGIDYEGTLSLESFYANANFRFPLSPFRVTAGVYSNGNEIHMSSAETSNIEIGGEIYTPAEYGTLSSTTSFPSTAPYLGFGYDFSLAGKVGLNLDFGVLWQGEPTVTMSSNGLLENDQDFQDNLDAERLQLEDDMSDLKAWPVISLGFVFNF